MAETMKNLVPVVTSAFLSGLNVQVALERFDKKRYMLGTLILIMAIALLVISFTYG